MSSPDLGRRLGSFMVRRALGASKEALAREFNLTFDQVCGILMQHGEPPRVLSKGACRIKTDPTRMQADICMNLHISLPRAKVRVPNDVEPPQINVDVSNQVAEVIRKATGLPVTIEIVHH